MSAALSQPDEWQVAEQEPPAADHAAAAKGHADMAAVHSMAAMGAARQAQEAHEGARGAADAMDDQSREVSANMQAWATHVEAMMQQAVRAAADARETEARLVQTVETQRAMLASFETIAAALTAPRRMSVTKRGVDGAIQEIVSGTPGNG